jgi:Protein of unknown function (DUF2797)
VTLNLYLSKMNVKFESLSEFSSDGLSFEALAKSWESHWNAHLNGKTIRPSYRLSELNEIAGNECQPPVEPGQRIHLRFTGQQRCTICNRDVKKLFDGSCYPCLTTKAQTDRCVMNPVTCHMSKGTCREPLWGLTFCYQPHLVYLAFTDKFKVGITRLTQLPTRWADQGATVGLPVALVSSRHQAGIIENELRTLVADKSHWLKMLQNGNQTPSMETRTTVQIQIENHLKQIYQTSSPSDHRFFADAVDGTENSSQLVHLIQNKEWCQIQFPQLPELSESKIKFQSVNSEKCSEIEMNLNAIKGQYLIFGQQCVNMRRHEGQEIEWELL